MTDRFRFLDALIHGVRTLGRRPGRTVAYIAAASLLTYGNYLWVMSGQSAAFLSNFGSAHHADIGTFLAMLAGSAVFNCVLLAGAYRAYLRDEPGLHVPLQLGLDELRLLGLYLLIWLIGLVSAGMILLLIAQLARASADSLVGALAPELIMIGLLICVAAMLYVFGRFFVSFALTIRDRKFRLGGWRASKGAGMQLFWAHLALCSVLLAVPIAMLPQQLIGRVITLADVYSWQDPAFVAVLTTYPEGSAVWLLIPLQTVLVFLLVGPTAALAGRDGHKREAAVPAAAPAPGVGRGETGG
ncbi:hypothetical protein [Maricaulis sp.]|uniref:hypothetical protein n=1 Tax=Maricaulis sp. TaxID=1486257 RepID=UPI003A93650E